MNGFIAHQLRRADEARALGLPGSLSLVLRDLLRSARVWPDDVSSEAIAALRSAETAAAAGDLARAAAAYLQARRMLEPALGTDTHRDG